MSASTRLSEKVDRDFADLSRLAVQALRLIDEEKRSPRQVAALKRALQLFKENSLKEVTGGDPDAPTLQPAKIQAILSQEVAQLTLSEKARRYFAERGIVLLGETMAIKWDRRFDTRREIEEYLNEVGIDPRLDPLEIGWTPPYWEDDIVLNRLSCPLDQTVRQGWTDTTVSLHLDINKLARHSIRTLGEALLWARDASGRGNDGANSRLAALHNLIFPDSEVRAGMIVTGWYTPLPLSEEELVGWTAKLLHDRWPQERIKDLPSWHREPIANALAAQKEKIQRLYRD